MAADSMATENAPLGGGPITKHQTEKIILQHDLMWGTSGSVGVRQMVHEIIEHRYDGIFQNAKTATQLRLNIIKAIHEDVIQYYRVVYSASLEKGTIPFANFLFGVYIADSFHLLNIEGNMDGDVVEPNHFCTGSGTKTGQALLGRLGDPEWDLRSGAIVAYRTMHDAIEVEPFGIGHPIRLARYCIKDGSPQLERIEGSDFATIRDTAGTWKKSEQEQLPRLAQSSAPVELPPLPTLQAQTDE
jgi:hypothetical protein